MLVGSSVTGHILKHKESKLNLLMRGLWLVWIPSHNFVLFFYVDLLLYRSVSVPARSSVFRLLGLWARIPPGERMYVVCIVCCQSSLHPADDPSTGVPPNVVCLNVIVEPLQVRKPWPTRGCCAMGWRGGGAILYSFLSAVQSMCLSVKTTVCLS
jgi:hypothetical protein